MKKKKKNGVNGLLAGESFLGLDPPIVISYWHNCVTSQPQHTQCLTATVLHPHIGRSAS